MEFVTAGVWGFVLKDTTFDEFVATIRAVAAGGNVLRARWLTPPLRHPDVIRALRTLACH